MNRYLTLLLVTLIAVVSCKKVVEDQKKDAVLDIMTGGQWYVQSYIEAGADITAQFENYRFQFLEDGKVTAVNGSFTASGTWSP